MFGGLGMGELIVIFMVVLLLFGAKRLPEIGSSLGKGIREFKGSLRELEGELKVPPERRPTPRVESRPSAQVGSGQSQGDQNEDEGPRKLGD
jgi:sec-independent protein translocase protein TatA